MTEAPRIVGPRGEIPEESADVVEQSVDLLDRITRAVSDPRIDVVKMEKLLDIRERIVKHNAELAYIGAKHRIKNRLPDINKEGVIFDKEGNERSRFAKYAAVDEALSPLLYEEGLTLSFNSESRDGKFYSVFCTTSHVAGHSETKSIFLPLDSSPYRSPAQNVSSTISIGRRLLTMMSFDIVPKDVDDELIRGAQPITRDQVLDLEAKIEEVKADKTRFLEKVMKVPKTEDILQRDYQKALIALELKRDVGR